MLALLRYASLARAARRRVALRSALRSAARARSARAARARVRRRVWSGPLGGPVGSYVGVRRRVHCVTEQRHTSYHTDSARAARDDPYCAGIYGVAAGDINLRGCSRKLLLGARLQSEWSMHQRQMRVRQALDRQLLQASLS